MSKTKKSKISLRENYSSLIDISKLLESVRRTSARAVNAILTATYWEIGRRIILFEQKGTHRAQYGNRLLENLSADLTQIYGKGFSIDNIKLMRLFYFTYPLHEISETVSRKLKNELDRDFAFIGR